VAARRQREVERREMQVEEAALTLALILALTLALTQP
jgi:hypothetical protein